VLASKIVRRWHSGKVNPVLPTNETPGAVTATRPVPVKSSGLACSRACSQDCKSYSPRFVFLRTLTGLTKGNLSSHLVKLEQGGLVAIEKTFEGRQPITYVALTKEGRDVLKTYWRRFDKVRKGLRALKPLRSVPS